MKRNDTVTKTELTDITEWDSINWGKAIKFIDRVGIDFEGKRVLEIGAWNGGMSLYFARRGGYCTCTDIRDNRERAIEKHKRWEGVSERVNYEVIDALNMPDEYENQFDIVTFKSVLGGIGANKNLDNERKFVQNISKVLKRDGYCIFIENMKGSIIHTYLRGKFSECGTIWDYQTDDNIRQLFSKFELLCSNHYGILGCFGINEKMREMFGIVDCVLEKCFLPRFRYVGVYIFRKRLKDM